MPIRTYHNGAFLLVMSVMLGIMTVFSATEVAAAKPVTATNTVVKQRATKGATTKSAYVKRRSGTTSAKPKAVAVAKTVDLPTEQPGDAASSDVVSRAMSVVGSRYRWGGTNKSSGFDCSGLVRHVLGDKANNLPRSSRELFNSISKTSEIKPGDIVFFGRGYVRHAAVYIGDGNIVHASTPRSGVRVDSLSAMARSLGYQGAGRI